MSKARFWTMNAAAGVGRVDIYEEIGFWGTSAKTFLDEWKVVEESAKRIEVHISSPGGDLFAAFAIYNTIQQSAVPVDIYIDGWAASCASLIAMAGRKSYMAENALLMLHNPWTVTVGNKAEHERIITALEAATEAMLVAYVKKSGKTRDEVASICDAETWYGSAEALDAGLVDEVIEAKPMAAKAVEVEAYGYSVPELYRGRLEAREPEMPAQLKEGSGMDPKEQKPVAATLDEIRAACDGCDSEFLVGQLEKKATVSEAQMAWTKLLKARVDEAKAETEAAKAEAAKAKSEKEALEAKGKKAAPGGDPLGGGANASADDGDPIAAWDEALSALLKAGKSKREATRAIAIDNKELHQAYIRAYNERVRQAQ